RNVTGVQTCALPIYNHSLTGCQGELVDADFDIQIENEDGEVIVDEMMNSGKNGFIDLWLPREQNYHVTVDYDGKSVESELSTFEIGRASCREVVYVT